MNHLKPPKKAVVNAKEQVQLELSAWKALLRHEWPLVVVLIVLISLLLIYINPFPPKKVGMAVGEKGSASAMYGEQLVGYFAEHGVTLELTHVAGTKATIDAMVAQGDIQSALLFGGTYKKAELKDIVSLGSVQYEPLWLFYQGPTYEGDSPLQYFSTKRFSIGLPDTSSQQMVIQLLSSRNKKFTRDEKLAMLSSQEAADALIKGDLDAMAIVDSVDSPVIQRLLAAKNVKIATFPLAAAYVKKLTHLDVVTVPRGSLDLALVYPPENINMVASTMNIVAEESLHPAVQLLFLMAADHFGDARDQFFSKPDEFPSYKDQTIPISKVAKAYSIHGPPSMTTVLPFWVASLIDRIWVLVVGILAFGYPLYRMLPNYRKVVTQQQLSGAYASLREAEAIIRSTHSLSDLEEMQVFLQGLEQEVITLNMSDDDLKQYYSLLSHIGFVHRLLAEAKNRRPGS